MAASCPQKWPALSAASKAHCYRFTLVNDHEILDALRDGRPRAVAKVARTYSDHLFDYCYGLIGESEQAADAVHSALLVAVDRVDRLRGGRSPLIWLYALARNEALRQRDEIAAAAPAPQPGLSRAASRAMAALSTLNRDDRELVDLTARHGLRKSEISKVFRVNSWVLARRIEQARTRAETAWRSLWLAHTNVDSCAGLASAMSGWQGAFTTATRRRVESHLPECGSCRQTARPEQSFVDAYREVPLALAPADLERRLTVSAEQPEQISYRGSLAEPFHLDGFPVRLDATSSRRPVVAWAAVIVVLTLVAGSALWLLHAHGSSSRDTSIESTLDATHDRVNVSGSPPPARDAPSRTASPSARATASASPSGKASRSNGSHSPGGGSHSPSGSSGPPSSSSSAGEGTISAILQDQSTSCGSYWQARVTVTIEGASAKSVTVQWQDESGSSSGSVPATPQRNGTYRADLDSLPSARTIHWKASAQTDSETLTTPTYTTRRDFCG